MKKLKVAIIGTNGVPAQYGGFETLVDYLADYLPQKYDLTIYCSKNQKGRLKEYKGAKLKYLPLSANGIQGILYDALSVLLTAIKFDQVLVLGCGSIITLQLFRHYGYKFTLNIGGIDWKRSKWGKIAKCYIRKAEKSCILTCSKIVSDNEGIRQYIKNTYGKESTLIEYGGDQVTIEPITEEAKALFPFLGTKYVLVVARIQSDNNIEMVIKAAIKANKTLVVVGNWNFSKYGKELREKYSSFNNLYLVDAIYDQKLLNIIRSNAYLYVHGHSGGGTNPSLLEIMFLKVPVCCFNNGYNNYTTEDKAFYFKNVDELANLMNNLTSEEKDNEVKELFELASRRYTWKRIAQEYAKIIES